VADLLRDYNGLDLLSSPAPTSEAPGTRLGNAGLPADSFDEPSVLSQPGNFGTAGVQEALQQVGNDGGPPWRGDEPSGGAETRGQAAAVCSRRRGQLPSGGSEAVDPAGPLHGLRKRSSATQQDREGRDAAGLPEGAMPVSGVRRTGLEYRVLEESEWMGGSQGSSDRGERDFVPTQSLNSLLAGLPALGSHFDPDFDFNIRMPGRAGSDDGRESGVWELAPAVDHVAATGQLKTCSEEGDCTVRPFPLGKVAKGENCMYSRIS
jgi:hypothetical protein